MPPLPPSLQRAYLHLPETNRRRCFDPEDMAALQARLPVILGEGTGATPTIEAEFADRIGILVTGWGTPPLAAKFLDSLPNLGLLVHAAGSIKRLVPPDIWTRGLRIATTNDAIAVGVAETALGMAIAGLKGFFPSRDWTRLGKWSDPTLGTGRMAVRELYRVTVGVISASRAGLHLIRLLRNFEVRILLYDPYMKPETARDLGCTLATLDDLVCQSHVVSLHAPALPATKQLLKAQHFRAMKDGAIFINTARGMVVDEQALLAELETGRISAFIDVTDPEPPAADHPFRRLPNVVLTPHLAGAVSNGCLRQGRMAVDQILAFVEGRPISGEVTREMFERMA